MSISSVVTLVQKIYVLARPYGRRKLGIVFLWILAQGVMQVIGVTSIFPFLAIASDPDRLRSSAMGSWLLRALPPIDNHQLLMLSGIAAISFLFISNAVNLASEVMRVRYAHAFGHWLQIRLIRQIAAQPYSFFLNTNSSVLIKKVVTDVLQYVQWVLLPFLDSIARLLTVLLLLLLIFVANPFIALSAGTVLGGFYVIMFVYLNRRLCTTSEGLGNAARGNILEVTQLIGGIKPVKLHRAEEYFIDRFRHYSKQQAQLLTWVPLYSTGPRYLVEPLAFGGIVLIVLIRAVQGQGLADVLPVLGVMALAGYRIIPTLQLLYSQLTNLFTTLYSLDELYEEFVSAERDTDIHEKPFGQTLPLQWSKEITLDNISFLYPETRSPILNNISLRIPKNASVAFVGRTGCGKSTLLDLILGLHRPTSGRLLVDGRELTLEDIPSWLANIGYVPQDIFLLDDTITANIAFGLTNTAVDHERVREVCSIAQILSFIEHDLPDGFNTVVGERGIRLSGGQRQRLGLARALYRRPELLIMDEATSALDQHTEADLNDALEPLRGTVTMLIVAHRPSTINRCTHVYTLSSGVLEEKLPCSEPITASDV